MLVYINDDVPEGDGNLLKNIQSYIIEASKALWTATNNLHSGNGGIKFSYYFIRIPITWKYPFFNQATWHQCSNADIFVSSMISEPFTKQIGDCGKPGEFMRYPYQFFESGLANQNKGKIMMNEFVKYRYGVFSEKPYRNMMTYFDGQKFAQSTCGKDIKWILSKPAALCSDIDNNCKYYIEKNQNHLYSVMFDEETESSKFFCNNNTHFHNFDAKSLQNIKCKGKSISDVILQHSDFYNISTAKSNFAEPQAIIVKGSNRKIVLIIDSSGSMESKYENLKNAIIEFIMNSVEDTAEVGLVSFNDTGIILSKLLSMNDKQNKEELIRIITNMTAGGSTNISDGIDKAFRVLGSTLDSLDVISGHFILLTDGRNNEDIAKWSYYVPVMLEYKGVIVNSISYGTDADENLIKLAKFTGGRFFYADPRIPYPDLVNKFSMQTSCGNPEKLSIKVFQGYRKISRAELDHQIHLMNVDPYIGIDPILTITFLPDLSQFNIKLINPKNISQTPFKIIKEQRGTTFSFNFPDKPEVGLYKLSLSSPSKKNIFKWFLTNDSINFNFTMSAKRLVNARTINPSGKLSETNITQVNDLTSIIATVDMTTCQLSKTDQVSVNVTMTDPNQKVIQIIMNDKGIGGDSVENDDIYSAVFYANELNVEGYFTFQAFITIITKDLQYPIQRSVDLDALLVKRTSSSSIVDRVSPARIINFNISILNISNRTLIISFLATGNDGLLGRITEYQIAVTVGNISTLLTDYVESQPLERIKVELQMPNITLNQIFTLAIRGVDPVGNIGEWSPVQIFSWDYDKIWIEYSKSTTGSILINKIHLMILIQIVIIWYF